MEARVKRARGQRNAEQVVAGGPGQVLAHHAQGGPRQLECRGNGRGLGAQEQHVACLLGQVCARAHGDAGVGLGQSCCVVDAVAHHGHAQAAPLQGANACQLSGRVQAGLNLGDAGLPGDRLGRGGRVAGKHEHAQAAGAQCGDGFGCVWTQRVAGIEVTGRCAVESHPQARDARLRRWCAVRKRNRVLAEERVIAEQAIAVFDPGCHASAGQNLRVLRRLPYEAPGPRGIHHRVSQRMVRPFLGRGGHA